MRKAVMLTAAASVLAPLGAFALAPSSVAGAATKHASTTTTTPAPPIQSNNKHALFLYVDTVQGSSGTPKPSAPCQMTNLFVQGQQVVFRMWGVDVAAGGTPLTTQNVQSAWVYVPGKGKIPLDYGTHGTVSYWTAAFGTTGYPLGVVDFHVTVVTKPVPKTATSRAMRALSGVFTQRGMPASSRLTIS